MPEWPLDLGLRDKNSGMEFEVGNIFIDGDVLLLRMTLTNRTQIGYTTDFMRFYIQDAKIRKKTAVQQLEQNILSVYAKLYHKYQQDKACVPEGNLVEVKFEDFEADALGMTEEIYRQLSLPGWEESKDAIAAYVGSKKGYKKNKYKYDPRTVDLVEKNWHFAIDDWGYERAK